MRVAVIGATGLVGRMMLRVLEERKFPVTDLLAAASDKSAGRIVEFRGESHKVINLEEALSRIPAVALFSAGSEVSLQWAPRFAGAGAVVIDNSSAWRMSPVHKLIVPEVNGGVLTKNDRIIANPNCSTIQLVLVLAPLHKQYGIRRIIVSTYQAVTGTGAEAVKQLDDERKGVAPARVYPHPIDLNCLPHCDEFLDNGYTKEEMKLVNETRKILNDGTINITATAVRIPVKGGHSESVNVEFSADFTMEEVRQILSSTPGVVLLDDVQKCIYPMPLLAEGRDEVFVGRLRRDESQPNTLNLWIVADNLRKGAATNAVQIGEYMV